MASRQKDKGKLLSNSHGRPGGTQMDTETKISKSVERIGELPHLKLKLFQKLRIDSR